MLKNKYLIILICLISVLTNSCKDANFLNEPKQNDVLLSELTLPKGYEFIFKDKYYPEGEMSSKDDSIYVFKKKKSEIEIRIKYFNKNRLEDLNERINSFTEILHYENSSFTIQSKKVNKESGIWFIKYTIGTKDDLMYNFYMERNTFDYRIMIKSFDFNISPKDIEFLYSQLSKYPGFIKRFN